MIDIEKAIEKLEYVNRWYNCNNYYSKYELDCIEVLLDYVEKLQKENKKLNLIIDEDIEKTEKNYNHISRID